jgi:tetratricopeptide (TPR) repeat protein
VNRGSRGARVDTTALWLLLLLGAGLASCARAPVKPPAPPEGYTFPTVKPGETTAERRQKIEKAWLAVLAGEVPDAERDYLALLKEQPDLVPAETGLAFARLRGERFEAAAQGFARVLERRADYFPALVGGALTALKRDDPETALDLLRRAQEVDPRDVAVKRRLGDVRLQVTERRVAAARAASQAGDQERAIETYRKALGDAPEVPELRLELADALATRGDLAEATSILLADPSGDRRVQMRLGELLAQAGEYERALGAYRRVLEKDPRDEEARTRAHQIREQWEMQQMPEEYRRIPTAPAISRADLAALLAVKVTALGRLAEGEPRVAVDISGSWARAHIIKVLALDLMTVYPNHTFQPGATVRRGDLARAVQKVLDLMGRPPGSAPAITDMSPTNLFHYPATRVVAAGLMDLTPEGAFQAWRPVSGPEADSVIEGLVRLVGP